MGEQYKLRERAEIVRWLRYNALAHTTPHWLDDIVFTDIAPDAIVNSADTIEALANLIEGNEKAENAENAEAESTPKPSEYYSLTIDGVRHECDEVFNVVSGPDAYETYYLCAALKYGIRAGRKTEDPTQDIEKLHDCVAHVIRHHERIGGR